MAYEDVPGFVAGLRSRDSVAALALEFLILTASRLSEALGVRWLEINREKAIWTIPPERMKAGRLHRVPLSGRALAILDKLPRLDRDELVFPGQRRGRSLSSSVQAIHG
jgi:integrase